jgi:hypothetical protein
MLKMPANLVLPDLPGAVFVSNHSEKLPKIRMSGTLAACLLRTWRSNENSCGARSPDTAASWRELGISITLTYAAVPDTKTRWPAGFDATAAGIQLGATTTDS